MLSRVKHTVLGSSLETKRVFRGMRTLLWGTGGAKLLAVASIPIITRLYSPEDYSVLALYISFVIIGSSILTLRYTQAIPLPKTDGVAINLLVLCVKLVLALGFVLGCILFFYAESLFRVFSVEELTPWWGLVAIGFIGTALYEVLTLWATRKGEFKALAYSQFFQSLSGTSVKIIAGLLSFKPYGLFIGQLISQTAGVIQLGRSACRDYKKYRVKVKQSRQVKLALYYRAFVYFRLPSQLLLNLSMQAPILIAASMYEKGDVGQLSLAMIALSLPVSVIGQSVSQSYYSAVAKLGKQNLDTIMGVTLSTQLKMFSVGLPLVLFGYIFLEYIFIYVFGDEWSDAGRYASVLSIYLLFAFTSSPFVQVLNIVSDQVVFLYINIFRVCLLSALFVYCQSFEVGVDEFVVYFSSVMIFFFIMVSFYILYSISRARSQYASNKSS
jgi:O-antigen/teichoic acid export membrane protein